MGSSILFRWAGLAAVVGGVLWALWTVGFDFVGYGDPGSPAYERYEAYNRLLPSRCCPLWWASSGYTPPSEGGTGGWAERASLRPSSDSRSRSPAAWVSSGCSPRSPTGRRTAGTPPGRSTCLGTSSWLAYTFSEHVHDQEDNPEGYLRRFLDELLALKPGLRQHLSDELLGELKEELFRREDAKFVHATITLIEEIEEHWRSER